MLEFIDYAVFYVNGNSFDMIYNGWKFYFEFDNKHTKDYTQKQSIKILNSFETDMTKEELENLLFNS